MTFIEICGGGREGIVVTIMCGGGGREQSQSCLCGGREGTVTIMCGEGGREQSLSCVGREGGNSHNHVWGGWE